MPVLLKSVLYKTKVWKNLSFPDMKTEAQGRQSLAKALGYFRIRALCLEDWGGP